MQDLMRVDYTLIRRVTDKHQTEDDMVAVANKHCTAYMDVLTAYTDTQAGELITVPVDNMADGVYVVVIGNTTTTLTLTGNAAILYCNHRVYNNTAVEIDGAFVVLHGRYVDVCLNADGIDVVVTYLPLDRVDNTQLVDYRPSKDGITYRHIGG